MTDDCATLDTDDLATVELKKLRAETRKLYSDINAARGIQLRAWITSLSVVASIVFTLYQAAGVVADISLKERQLTMESVIRSHQLFLDIVPRMSGIESVIKEFDAEKKPVKETKQELGGVTQASAYSSAVALACEFSELRLPAEAALTFQLALVDHDYTARAMLKRLTDGCQDGYNEITDEERDEWPKRQKEILKSQQEN